MTAHGGRGLAIITSLARTWGVDERGRGAAGDARGPAGVKVWAVLAPTGDGALVDSLAGLDLSRAEGAGRV